MTILGVDLGTTNSLAVVYKEGKPVLIPNAYGEYVTPSAVSILDGKIVVGKLAKERLITHPECSASLFKRNMGTDVTYTLDKKEYDSATLSSFILKQLIEDAQNYLHESIDEVVISVPAYFNARQRQDTKRIGELLGIKVERLINEPSAAAIACHMDDEYETFVMFDFGGGTLDLCLAAICDDKDGKRKVETQSAVGITYGGNDINQDILDDILAVKYPEHIKKAFEDVKNKSEETNNRYKVLEAIDGLKSDLFDEDNVKESKSDDVIVDLYNRSMIEFKDISVGEIYKTFEKKRLKEKIYNLLNRLYDDSEIIVNETTDVFVIGGSASIPYFRKIVEQYFESNGYKGDIDDLFEINDDMDSDERLYSSVAKGAAIFQELKSGDSDIDIVIKEKIPFVVYTKNDLGKIQTKITKNDFYKDYFSTYAGLTKHMKEENKISVYQTVCGETDKEVYLGDILLSDEIVENADLYKLKVDEQRNIEAVFGTISPDENDDTIFDKWKSQLVIDTE